MFSRKSVQQHGRARQVKGLRSPLCCRAVKMQMTGLTSCCLKEPLAHLYNSGDSHRGDFQTDLSQGAAQAAGQASLNGGQAAPPFVQHDDRDSLGWMTSLCMKCYTPKKGKIPSGTNSNQTKTTRLSVQWLWVEDCHRRVCEGWGGCHCGSTRRAWIPCKNTHPDVETYTGGIPSCRQKFFFFWMLHGSTKVVVRAVALLSAKTKWRVANSMEICFLESNNINQTKNAKHTNHDAVSQRVQGRVGVACSSDG